MERVKGIELVIFNGIFAGIPGRLSGHVWNEVLWFADSVFWITIK
tara:strand:- start:680 stop:814 length:135 start_codon:yes stop_codon:yes gene_type:complete